MQLYIYKRGQGYHTRLWTSLACFALACWGSFRLSEILAVTANVWVEYLVPAAVVALLSWGIYYLQNRPSVANFLIDAEGELKKVSWSSKSQIVAATSVVITVVIVFSVLLGLIDIGFTTLFESVLKLYS